MIVLSQLTDPDYLHLGITACLRTLSLDRNRATRVCAAAYGLKRRGIGRGDRVCVICPNVPMILDMQQALPAIHAIPVLMNIRLTKPEVDYILEHSGSKMILVDSEFKHLADGFKGEVIVSNDSAGKDRSDPYEQLIAEGMQDAQTKGWQGLTLIDDEEAGFNLCYTSGTTGRYVLSRLLSRLMLIVYIQAEGRSHILPRYLSGGSRQRDRGSDEQRVCLPVDLASFPCSRLDISLRHHCRSFWPGLLAIGRRLYANLGCFREGACDRE